jgi:transposase
LPQERVSARKMRELLRLRYELKLSQEQIARSCCLGQSTVFRYLKRFEASDLVWPLPDDCDDRRLEELLFFPPAPSLPGERARIDFATLDNQLQTHRHLTLLLLWDEYKTNQPDGYRYSYFCELYRKWKTASSVVLRQDHRAGEKMFVDWAGATVPLYDAATGQVSQRAYLFVATLGASSYTYAFATLNQDLRNWIDCHVRAFDFFGGCPTLVIPDNPRTAVNKACRYEPDLNRTYLEMAQHYGVAVMPARPRKPRDKAYVSYCTSSRLCNGEHRLLSSSASLAFKNRTLFERFVETTADVVVTVLSQPAFSGPKVDCSGGHCRALISFAVSSPLARRRL